MDGVAHPPLIIAAAEHTGHRRNAQLFNVFARIQVIFHIHNHLTFLAMDSELIGTSNAGAIEQRINGKGGCPRFYRIKPEEILVLHDELDLPPGTVKLKQGGGHGGHNGLKDIVAQLGNSNNFYRLRIGIGHPGHRDLVSGFVLNKPAPAEREALDKALDEATDCIELLFKEGMVKATNRLNSFKI